MQTVFDICSKNYVDYDNYSGQFDIITLYCNGQYLTWDLRLRKGDNDGLVFALILSSSNIVIPCATFSVEYVNNVYVDKSKSRSFLVHQGFHTLVNVKFEKTHIFCQTAVNVKLDDAICVTLPSEYVELEDNRRVRCTIIFPENAEIESKMSPSVSQKLFQDVVSSTTGPPQFADVILTTADDRKFHVHSCFLAKQSSVFNAMLQDGKFKEGKERQIETPDINAATMEEILRYIYTECTNLDALKVMAPEILYATEKYLLPEALKLQCAQTMIDSLNVSNVLTFLITADMYSLDKLKRCGFKVVVDNLSEILEQDGWKEILKKQDLVNEMFQFIAKNKAESLK